MKYFQSIFFILEKCLKRLLCCLRRLLLVQWCKLLQTNKMMYSFDLAHVRTGSAGSALDWERQSEDLRCIKVNSIRAHQQPITVLDCENGRVVTGSQDHTLKVHTFLDVL